MSAADDVRGFLLPLLPAGWRLQFGAWQDGSKTDKYAVLRPMGGLPAALVRHPHFSLMLIGAENQPSSEIALVADTLIEAMREPNPVFTGNLISLQPAEPVHHPTNDGRAVFEIAISAITT